MTKPYRSDRVLWWNRANCADTDPELFFPDPSEHAKQSAVIAEYCSGCLVKAECLEDDLAASTHHWGIRGGLSAADRDALSVRRGKTPGRRETCPNGHLYPEDAPRGERGRQCVPCARAAQDRKRARNRVGAR